VYKDNYPSKLLENAVDAISSLPGVGERSAMRLALHLLRQPKENVQHFTQAINDLRENVCYCRECRMISDSELCEICSDRNRDHSKICVVENIQDVMSIENTAQYNGTYHVLGGIISPINGIGPADLNINALKERLERMASHNAESAVPFQQNDGLLQEPIEIIFALPSDVEGETTAFYLYRQIEKFNVKVTALARGLGFGDSLQYADAMTLGRSITGRQPFSLK